MLSFSRGNKKKKKKKKKIEKKSKRRKSKLQGKRIKNNRRDTNFLLRCPFSTVYFIVVRNET